MKDDMNKILYEYVKTFRTPIDLEAIFFNTLKTFQAIHWNEKILKTF